MPSGIEHDRFESAKRPRAVYDYSVQWDLRGSTVLWSAIVRHDRVLKGTPGGQIAVTNPAYARLAVHNALISAIEALIDVKA